VVDVQTQCLDKWWMCWWQTVLNAVTGRLWIKSWNVGPDCGGYYHITLNMEYLTLWHLHTCIYVSVHTH